jgi:hypothetical protein
MSSDDPTDPMASPAPSTEPPPALPVREPSPYLLSLTRTYCLAPRGSADDVDLQRLHEEECERQGFRVYELLQRPEFVNLDPEERE